MNRGPPARHADDFAISPAHAMIPARAERLHRRFFGGEPCGITLHSIRLGIAVTALARGKDPLQKSFSEAINRLPDARDLSDIDACADNHRESESYSKRSPR
jgi:hypothetical protein